MKKYNLIEEKDFSFIVIEDINTEIYDVMLDKNQLKLLDSTNNIIETIKLDERTLSEIKNKQNFYVIINSQPYDVFVLKLKGNLISNKENKRLKRY